MGSSLSGRTAFLAGNELKLRICKEGLLGGGGVVEKLGVTPAVPVTRSGVRELGQEPGLTSCAAGSNDYAFGPWVQGVCKSTSRCLKRHYAVLGAYAGTPTPYTVIPKKGMS